MSVKYVEYLETDGNSYFELPAGTITWDNNSGIEMQYYHDAYANSSYLIGAYGQNGNTSIYTYYEQLGIYMLDQNFIKSWDTNEYKANIQPYAHTIKIDKNGRTFDGVTESITWSEPESWIFERINLSPVRIFGQGSNQGDSYKKIALQGTRIYYVKIYNGDEVVHYFRPCLKGNTPCMYDEISQTFYYNQGTGTFSYGRFIDALYLFADNNEGTAENLGSYRLYNMKIDGDDPRDFQPVLDSNGVPCLMDNVNKKYYYDKNGNGFKYNGYTPVGYLEGDGASWIDTNIIPTENIKIIVNGHFTQVKAYDTLFGGDGTKVQCGANSNQIYVYSGQNQHAHTYTNAVNIPHTYTLTHTQLKIDNDVLSLSSIGTIQNYSILLFGGWNRGVVEKSFLSQGKVYYFKIYQSDELVFDGIPVLDNNNTPCMYDLVTETFFYNQGTGEFSYGIEEDEYSENYTPIKYIETNGTQYIDTGVVVNDNTYMDMIASAVGETPLYLMNGLTIDTTYKYNEVDTTVEPNLTASDGATLTLGSTYIAYLTESEIEQAVDNGWTIQ